MMWVVLLFIAGIGLIFAEVLLPGAVLGILGAICLMGSAGLAIYEYPGEAFWIIIAELIGLFISIVIGFYLFPRIGPGRKLILENALSVEEGYVSNESDETLMGQIATAFTALRPAGTILLGEKRIDAVTTGNFISEGDSVRIVEVHGNRIVVEPADV